MRINTRFLFAALNATKAAEGVEGTGVPEGYSEGFVRVKPDGSNRGSFVEGVDTLAKTRDLLERLEWFEVPRAELPAGACDPDERVSYFRAELPEDLRAFTGVVPLSTVANQRVVCEQGDHGPELTLEWGEDLVPTTEVWAITGPLKGREGCGLWAWYPGPIGTRATKRHTELLSKWEKFGRMSLSVDELNELHHLPVKLKKRV